MLHPSPFCMLTNMLPLRMLVALVFMFLLSDVVSTCPAEHNPLTLDPPEVKIKYGQDLLVNCTSIVQDHEGMQWCSGTECTDMENERAFVQWALIASEWNINGSCIIKLNETVKCSKDLEITVYKNPDMAYLHPVGVMVEGEQHKLQCDIINVAPVQDFTVRWSKDDITIKTTSFTKEDKTPANFSSFLPVSVSREKDEVQYSCEAQLDYDTDLVVTSSTIIVSVNYAPELKYKTADVIDVEEGNIVTVSCEADGNPPPDYHWTKDGKMLENENNPSLTITEVNANATYTCTASNTVGSITEQIHVYVKRKISPPVVDVTTPAASALQNDCAPTLMPSELVVRFGESASINCTSSHPDFEGMGWEAPHGGSGFVKIPIVTWKVERVEVWKPDPFCYVTLKNDEQCTAYPNITVYKTPDSVSVSASSDEPLVEGREFLLTCDIINVAPKRNLIVKWYRDHEKVHTETFKNDNSEPPNNVTSTWKMIPKKSYNGTKFTCKAELDLGPKGPEPVPTATSEPYIAVVHFAPTFKEGNDSKEVNQGENVTFSCHAEGNPAPEIHWNYTSAESVWETSGGRQKNITIKATSTNAGVYICVATNEFGKVTRSVTLKIKGKADEGVSGFSWWHLVLKALIILIAFLLLVLFINLWRNHTIHRQYSFINPAIPLTTRA